MEGDAKIFWRQLKSSTVDLIFEQGQKSLLSLKQKIKNGTATEEECCHALALLEIPEVKKLLQPINVNVAAAEEETARYERGLHSSSTEIEESPGDVTPSELNTREVMHSSNKDERKEKSLKFHYWDHICSKGCLSKRPRNSYKNENPLNLPLRCHFQRWHAKADSGSKLHDVIYKAPCGRSLRNFKDVQHYLFQTECSFLFLYHFSFNTYVQVFRPSPNYQAFLFEFDISKGAETLPVSLCNEINREQLPYFKYRKVSWPRGYFLNNFSTMFLDSCSCTDGCTDATKCACLLLTERSCHDASMSSRKETFLGYNYGRLDEPVSSGIYECNLSCSCDKIACQNRVVQRGLQVRLQVFLTEKKGWGVRCLDDIDKGTFVCTYAGRLMSKDESQEGQDGGIEEAQEGSDGNGISKKTKRDSMCSDSDDEFVQTPERHSEPEDEPSLIQSDSDNQSWNNAVTSRPKTRTSVLQNQWRQLEIADARSDEDESSVCQKQTRTTPAGKNAPEKLSLQEEFEGPTSTVEPEVNTDCQKESPLSGATLNTGKRGTHLLWIDRTLEGKIEREKKEPACNKVAVDNNEASMKNENLYLLDATREGNVGRFLNVQNPIFPSADIHSTSFGTALKSGKHSCSPNLFVQSVFVETHDRNFPWVAFFTNRHVKAGTELTWDYGYEAGSRPDAEIACQCGAHKCRKKIL